MAAKRTTLNVSLTPESNPSVSAKVASWRHQSASEVVRAALRLLERAEPLTGAERVTATAQALSRPPASPPPPRPRRHDP
jgi:putative addiction module CopG family antidote